MWCRLTTCFVFASALLLTSMGWSDEGSNLCDSLASHPDDPPIGIGVVYDDLEEEKAIAACEVAIRDNPFHVYDALMLLDAEKTRRCSRDWRTGNDERQ